jgi:hypothetical protein
LSVGSTTTFGTGEWYISLPYVPSDDLAQIGQAIMFIPAVALYVGAVETLIDGTARCKIWADNAPNNVQSSTPAAWVNGSYLKFTLRYFTD